jgi:hypothetical protein
MSASTRVLEKGDSGRDPALRDSRKCSHINQIAASRALADSLMLVFKHPDKP